MNIRPEEVLNAPLMAHARALLRNSRRWFPGPTDTTERWQIEHQALGLAGEVGEVVEHVKKWHRGDFDVAELRRRLHDELPDVLTYLLNLSALIDVDLDAALSAKQAECEHRWGSPSPDDSPSSASAAPSAQAPDPRPNASPGDVRSGAKNSTEGR